MRLRFSDAGVAGRFEGDLWSATTIVGWAQLDVLTQELGKVTVEVRRQARRGA